VKKTLTILTCFFLTVHLSAQSVKSNQSVKTIIERREIYLNGGARATIDGKSRTIIPISLPENTVSWYYSFSTSAGESGSQNLNLFAQLYALTLDPTGLLENAASEIKVPTGSAVIDVYLLDKKNSNLFFQKVEYYGETYSYFSEGHVTNTKQAVVSIHNLISGDYFIGLRNPSTLEGVEISIEVVAIVQEVEPQSEEQSQAITIGNLGWKAFERGDYDKCIEMSKKALALDNSLEFVYFNIGLSYLIKGQNNDAVNMYSKAIYATKKSEFPKQYIEGAIADLLNYMDKFPSKPDAQDLLDILNEELENY